MHFRRRDIDGNLRGVIGRFVDGVAHDLGQWLHAGRKLAAHAVNGAVDREPIRLRCVLTCQS